MDKPYIKDLLEKRVLVLDGAMGTMIQQHRPTEEDYRGERFKNATRSLKGNNDLMTLTQPAWIREIHRQYLIAGADIIETNTFNANRISLADYGMESLVPEMNLAAAKLAKEAADEIMLKNPSKPRYVAGALGPTNKTASMSPDVNNPAFRAVDFDELREAYEESAKLEQDLASKYEWLIQNAEDQSAKQLLGKILFQTRMHAIMFSHALQMGGWMGKGMMYGDMWW